MSSSHGEVCHLFLCTMQSEVKKERKYELSDDCHILLLEQHSFRYQIVYFFPQVSAAPWHYQKSLTLEIANLSIVRPHKLFRAETRMSVSQKTGGQRLRMVRNISVELLACA